MKKAALAMTSLAALTVTTVALGQGPTEAGPTPVVPAEEDEAMAPAAPPVIAPGSQLEPQTPASMTTLTAAEEPAVPPLPPPASRETITVRQSLRPNRALLYTGGAMLISSYAATAAFAATQGVRDASGDQPLYIPVAGPWMHLANSSESMLDKALIAGSGVAQGAGVVLGVLSLLVPERVPAATIQAGDVTVSFTASSNGPGSAGALAVGRF